MGGSGLVKRVGAAYLIAAGVLLLLNTTGVLPWSIWKIARRYWPVMLIAWGAAIILDGSVKAGTFTGLILLALLGVFIIFAIVPGARRLARVDDHWLEKDFCISGDDYYPKEFRLSVEARSGNVEIVTDDGPDIFTSKARYQSSASEPSLRTSYSDGVLRAEYEAAQPADSFGPTIIVTRDDHEITLGRPALPTFLEMQVRSGTIDAFLEGLVVRNVEVEVGSGRLILTFPSHAPAAGSESLRGLTFNVGSGKANILQLGNAGMGRVSGTVRSGKACIDLSGDAHVPALVADLEVGSGKIELTVPEDVGLSIEARIGTGRLQIDGRRYDKNHFGYGEIWVSENYETATRLIDLVVRVGSGRIEVEHRR